MTDTPTPAPEPKKASNLRQLVDFSGLLAFGLAFLVFRLRGIEGDDALVNATWFLVAGSAVGVAVGLIVEKRLALMPLLVGGFALVFGLLTLLTGDGLWVKVKVSVLNASLAIALLGGLAMGKQPLRALLGTVIPINDRAWRTLTFRYGLFLLALAILNGLVPREALVRWAGPRAGVPGPSPGWGPPGPSPTACSSWPWPSSTNWCAARPWSAGRRRGWAGGTLTPPTSGSASAACCGSPLPCSACPRFH